MATSDPTLLEDTLIVEKVENDKYDRVSRIYGHSTDGSLDYTLDINHELFPAHVGDSMNMVLATTLNLDGTIDPDKGWRPQAKEESTLADMFDYVCHGKSYRFEASEKAGLVKFYASFGGLLMYIEGPSKRLERLKIEYVYLLLKR